MIKARCTSNPVGIITTGGGDLYYGAIKASLDSRKTPLQFAKMAAMFCTAMIYQSLKPIAAWHHPLTSVCYLAFSLLSGAALFAAIAGINPAAVLVLLFAVVAAVSKGLHYRRLGKVQDIRVGRAAGFSRAKAKLLETGHTGQTFLTREFMFSLSAIVIRRMRIGFMLLCFAPPVIGAAALLLWQTSFWMMAALPFMFAGLLGERCLTCNPAAVCNGFYNSSTRSDSRQYCCDGKQRFAYRNAPVANRNTI